MKRAHGIAAAFALLFCGSAAFADTYPRQPGVDAFHYVFRLEISDTRPEIVGDATVEMIIVRDNVSEVALDLASETGGKGMAVSAVTVGGQAAPYVHKADRLTIQIGGAHKAGEHVMIGVSYRGAPANGLRLIPNKYGEWSAFSENWPNRAREWLPMIDHPYDKATSEFIVTAPAKYQVVSNGLLQETRDLGDGRRVTHWKQAIPIASWLNAVGLEQFDVHYAGRVKDVELSTWVAHQDRDAGLAYFEEPARQALEFFSDHIGPYSYEKLANVAAAGINGGTEHASAIFYGERGVRAQPATGLVAHEIAHQWFGDSITETDWDHVWLSEGFATYFTHLFTEHYSGRDAMIEGLKRDRINVFALEKANPALAVIHDNLSDMSKVLNRLIYQKGGWVLHMLRGQIGTDTFWAGIREYYRTYRNGSATTADFERVMEQASGQDLKWFFRQWLYRAGSPVIKGSWQYNAAAKQIEIEIQQLQPGDAYRLPLEIGITAESTPQGGGAPVAQTRIERIESTERQKRFTIAADKAPLVVALDPNTSTLMQAEFSTASTGRR